MAPGLRRVLAGVEYSGKMGAQVHRVVVGKNAIFVAVSESLQVFDPQSGVRRCLAGAPK